MVSYILSKSKTKSERPRVKKEAIPFRSPTMMDLDTPLKPSVLNLPNAETMVSMIVGIAEIKGRKLTSFAPIFPAVAKTLAKLVIPSPAPPKRPDTLPNIEPIFGKKENAPSTFVNSMKSVPNVSIDAPMTTMTSAVDEERFGQQRFGLGKEGGEIHEDGRDNHLRVKNQDAATANAGAHLVGDTYSLSHTTHPLVHRSVSFAKNNNEGEEEDKNRDKINQSKNISALVQGNIAASSSMNDAGGAEMVGEDNNDEEENVVEVEDEEDTNAGGGVDESTSGSRSAALSSGRGDDFFSGEGGRPDLSSGI
jgi:hypothetical protein